MKNGKNNILQRALIACGMLVLLVYFFPHPSVSHYKFEEGRPWNYAKLIAPFDIPIHPDSATITEALDSLDKAFVPVYERRSVSVDSMARIIMARVAVADELTSNNTTGLATFVNKYINSFDSQMITLLRHAYSRGVIKDSLPAPFDRFTRTSARIMENKVLREVPTRNFTTVGALERKLDSIAGVNNCCRQLRNAGLRDLLVPNIVCNIAETKRLYANDKALITIDRGVIQRGQTIIDNGAIVSAQDYTNLKTYEQLLAGQAGESERSDFLMLLGQILYVAIMIVVLLGYLLYMEPDIWRDLRAILFMLTMIAANFLLGVLAEYVFSGAICVVPMLITPILILVFFNGRVAMVVAVVQTLLCAGLTTTFALEFIMIQFAGTAAVIFSLRDITHRSQILRASLFAAVGYVAAYFAVQLMMNGSFNDFSLRMVSMLVLNALLVSLTYVLMFLVERVFGFISNVTLVEIADSNSPLLRQLSDECPGTFQHSMAVATLASDAAGKIGANPLLVRAGAMYHDIGKMSNPIFFTENQHGVNPHDGLSPQRSAEIIISHVPEGLKRAERAGLPGVMRNFIREHHGAGKAKYFYITACRQAPEGTEVDPAPFTYPGPNPRSRETSVLMMADAVEAASRSLKDNTPKSISELVDRIIDGQIAEGLHNDSPLSFRDVGVIKKAFVKRIMTMNHTRISYPDAPKPSAPVAPVPPTSVEDGPIRIDGEDTPASKQ
ncbi:MAG: HD family phosphohydrolase [Muribaculaceae bacterium]